MFGCVWDPFQDTAEISRAAFGTLICNTVSTCPVIETCDSNPECGIHLGGMFSNEGVVVLNATTYYRSTFGMTLCGSVGGRRFDLKGMGMSRAGCPLN